MGEFDIIICPTSSKNRLLKEYSISKNLVKTKFMTKKEYISNYYYSYDYKTIYYLMNKYNYNLDVVKVYLDNLYSIDINKNYKSNKLNSLKEIKKELLENNLLYINHNFKEFISNKKIKVLNYYELEKYEEDLFNQKIELSDNYKELDVYEFNTLEEEVNNVCIKIIELLNKGININTIKLSGINDDYIYTIKRIFNYYKIPINLNNKISIYSNSIVKEYLEGKELKENETTIPIIKKIRNIEKDLLDIDPNSKEYKDIFIDILKHTYYDNKKYDNAINIINIYDEEINDDEYLFLLGFNLDVYPTIDKDIDFLSDIEKKEINMYSSNYKNKRRKIVLMNILSNIKNLKISYKLKSSFNNYYPSSLIDEYNFNVISEDIDNYSYSNIYNKIRLTTYLDNYFLYGEKNNNLSKLLTHYKLDTEYKSYNNKFEHIENYKLDKLPLKFSYTSINNYNECSFKYYLNYILKLNNYEDTFQAFIGSLYHNILTYIYDKDFNFESSFNNYLSNRNLNVKEKLLLVRIKNELIKLIEREKEQLLITGYNEAKLEEKLSIKLDKEIETYFEGFIDKIMYTTKFNDFSYSIVDYKSGSIDTDILPLKYGLHLQLPSYLYLINESQENPSFTGIYYQRILFDYPTWNNKDLNKLYKDNTKLVGYSTDDIERLEVFDSTYEKSELIKSMTYKDDKFGAYSKVLGNTDIEELIKYTKDIINESIDSIIEGNFEINPKIYNGKNISCTYCPFADICYKNVSDQIYLDKVEDLSFLGGDNNALD